MPATVFSARSKEMPGQAGHDNMIGLYILTAVPLALFIILLVVMDSFSLTRWTTLLYSIGAGMVMFLVSWLICRIPAIGGNRLLVSIVEELCKGAFLYILIVRQKVGLLGMQPSMVRQSVQASDCCRTFSS